MATADAPLTGFVQGDQAQNLALGWRRLTRAATIVALVTAVPVFVWLTQQRGWSFWTALLGTLALVIAARGLVDLAFHRAIPWPSLFGVDSAELREEDVVARRRAWFWRFWLKVGIFGGTIAFLCWRFLDAAMLVQILPLLIMLPIFLIFNFVILFGPLLLMNLSQIQAFEPGDAQWGVKLDDVRGQIEAKEEVRRVVSIWQSGEQFEKHGGKRERGVLFLGAPGTGKTMLAKALATGFNSPFISIPGSGFAATFIGIDAIVVRILARRAKKLARKWGGQCIVFIDEIDAVGMRRQTLGQGAPTGSTPLRLDDPQDLLHFGPWGARNPSGDLVLETRMWREKLFDARQTPQIGINGFQMNIMRLFNFMFPGGMGGGGGLALNQLLVVMDGIDNPPFFKKFFTNKSNTFLDGIYIVPRRIEGTLAAAPRREAAQGAGVLHRRDERPDRPARPGARPPRTHGSSRLVPDADQARPARHSRPLHREGLARPRPRHTEAPRRDRAHHERVLAGDDRAGHLDGAHDRAPLRA